MAQSARQLISFQQYLEIERESVVKHEYLDGSVWAMSGGSPDHSALTAKVISSLVAQLAGKKCRVFDSNLKIRVKATGLTTYPDASVICEKVLFDAADLKRHTATNPRLLVEVLSPSTEKYDRGEKLDHYKRIASLREVVFVNHKDQLIEVWRKTGSNWKHHAHKDVAVLLSLGCELAVGEVYRDPLA